MTTEDIETVERFRRVMTFNSCRGLHLHNIMKASEGLVTVFAPLSWSHADGVDTLTEYESMRLQMYVNWDPNELIRLDDKIAEQVAASLRAFGNRCIDAAASVEKVRHPSEPEKPLAYVARDRESREFIAGHYFYGPAINAASEFHKTTGKTAEVSTELLSDWPAIEAEFIQAMQFELTAD
ncbi:MAG: hypothetical protein V4719_04185 [Planctomycetota bacterium]